MGRPGILTSEDHEQLDFLLEQLFDAYKNGKIEYFKIKTGIGHIFAAIDLGNRAEIETWVHQDGISLF